MTKEEILKQTLGAAVSMIKGSKYVIQATYIKNDPEVESGWVDIDKLSGIGHPDILIYNYRIKPEKKSLLVSFDKMGPIVWVKNDGRIRLVIGFNSAGDRFHVAGEEHAESFINFAKHPDSKWSNDRKTWHSFYVEE